MSDKEMSWQRYEAGAGDREALYYLPVDAQHVTSPVVAMCATLIESDLDKIRQIVREELRQDWQEHIPFGEEMDEEEERKWQQTQQENDRRFMAELAQLVEASVRRAIYGDPPDPDDLPVQRNAPDPGGDTDDERVEASIVTVDGSQADYIRKLEHLLKSCVDVMENPSIAGDSPYTIHPYIESLCKRARELTGADE